MDTQDIADMMGRLPERDEFEEVYECSNCFAQFPEEYGVEFCAKCRQPLCDACCEEYCDVDEDGDYICPKCDSITEAIGLTGPLPDEDEFDNVYYCEWCDRETLDPIICDICSSVSCERCFYKYGYHSNEGTPPPPDPLSEPGPGGVDYCPKCAARKGL